MEKKELYWRILFVLMSAAYLLPEAVFNAQLVSLMGLGTPKPEQLEHLELFGRTISGIGVSLLIADLLPEIFYSSLVAGLVTLIMVTAIIWPTVFYGQKYLVEKFLVQSSTAGQRQYATFSVLLRDALAYNAVAINGVDYGPRDRNSSEGLTFISLFGGMVYADHNLANDLDKYKESIITNLERKNAYSQFEQSYQDYSELYKVLSHDYEKYAEGSNRYNQALVDIPKHEDSYWKQIDLKIKDGWQQYQKAQKKQVADAQASAKKYGPKIYHYFDSKDKCRKRYDRSSQSKSLATCLKRLDDGYSKEVSKAGFGYIKPNYWLVKEKISATENIAASVVMGVLTAGISTAMQLFSVAGGGDGGFKDARYLYTKDTGFYRKKILALPKLQESFKKKTGYSFALKTYNDFRIQPHTVSLLRQYFQRQGVVLPDSWKIDDRNSFNQAVAEKVKKEAHLAWQRNMHKSGLSLPINLNWEQFQLDSSVQAKIAQRMGELYIHNIRVDLNKANFKELVLEPNIQKRTQQYLAMLKYSNKEFADGGKYAEIGKQALRSIIIPPISMSLSLFLICMTLLKLPLKVIGLFDDEDDYELTPLNVSLIIVPIILLVSLPPLLVNNRYTEQSDSPVNYFLDKVSDSSNFFSSYALRWTLDVQPFLHPLGVTFERHTHIYQNFLPVAWALSKVDIDTNSLSVSNEKVERKNTIKKATLRVNCNVKEAQIRIMNIKARFKQGIKLVPGKYDIQVTAPGYQSYRRWHTLNEESQQLEITLQKNNF